MVKKSLDHPIVGDQQATEKCIYKQLGHHPFILRYYGEYHGQGSDNGVPNGLVLQCHHAGTLVDNLALENKTRYCYSPEKRAGLVSFLSCLSIVIPSMTG